MLELIPEDPSDTHHHIVLCGRQSTPGATGFLHVERQLGILYKDDKPWEPVRQNVASVDDFISWASTEHQQTLVGFMPPPGPKRFEIKLSDLPSHWVDQIIEDLGPEASS